jgi:hypothetical protein
MWEATEVDNPQHQGVSFSACLHGLFGKKEQWDSFQIKEGIIKKGKKAAKYQFGNVIWEGKNKETISIKSPVNRHYHGGEFLSKKVYLCGHEKKPEAPNLIIGACIKDRQISAVEKTGGKKPFIAVLLAPDTLGFYWLNSRAQWEKKSEIKLIGYRFDNMVYFSQDGNNAVTIVTKKETVWMPHEQKDIYIPYLYSINISNRTITGVLNKAETSKISEDIAPYTVKITIEAPFASEFVNGEIKTFKSKIEFMLGDYRRPLYFPAIEGVPTWSANYYYAYWDGVTGEHWWTPNLYWWQVGSSSWPGLAIENYPTTGSHEIINYGGNVISFKII